MKKLEILIIVCFIALFGLVIFALDYFTDRVSPAKAAYNSTVLFYDGDHWAGSGVIFHKYNGLFDATYILAAKHLNLKEGNTVRMVVERAGRSAEVTDLPFKILLEGEGSKSPAVDGDLSRDLILVVVYADIGNASPLGIHPKIGDKVFACSGNFLPVVTEGKIQITLVDKLRHNARISFGHSGSGVFDENGFIVGINSFVGTDVAQGLFGQPIPNINRERVWAINSKEIIKWLVKGGYGWAITS